MLVFAQVMTHLPLSTFRRYVATHRGDFKAQDISCLDQFYAMAFAQLTARESLRDIEVNLRAQAPRLYHMGFRCKTISRNTLANANATRPWQMYADFAQHLIGIARPLYADEPVAIDLDATVYAFDATTIDLCLSVYPWAPFRSTKAAVKVHTLLDIRGAIPSFIHITDGKTHEVNILDDLPIEPGAFYLMDRGYRGGPVCLNSFPRFISGPRAGLKRSRVVHGAGRRLRRTGRRGGQLGALRENHVKQPAAWAAAPRSTFRLA
jgi:hypothetical protein